MKYDNSYPLKINFVWLGVVTVILALCVWSLWRGYHSAEHISAVKAKIAKSANEDREILCLDFHRTKPLTVGTEIVILSNAGQYFWVQTDDGVRGLINKEGVENYEQLEQQPEIYKYNLDVDCYINITEEQMRKEFLGRSIEENEKNYQPPISYYTRNDTTFVSYHMRMFRTSDMKAIMPTVTYVNNQATDILYAAYLTPNSKNILPVWGSWAKLLYSSKLLHLPWDKGMLQRTYVKPDQWGITKWLIRKVESGAKYYPGMLCGLNIVVWIILLLLPFRVVFRGVSNDKITRYSLIFSAITTILFLPLYVLDNGTMSSIVYMAFNIFLVQVLVKAAIKDRCDTCYNVGSVHVIKKTEGEKKIEKRPYTEKGEVLEQKEEVTKRIEVELDGGYAKEHHSESKIVNRLYRYYQYERTYEITYYDHHCECKVCGSKTKRKNAEKSEQMIDQTLVKTYTRWERSHS